MRLQVDRLSAAILVVLGIILLLAAASHPTRATAGDIRSLASVPNTNLDLTPLQNIVQVAAGGGHTCALTSSGGVKCWGDNQYGQLGDGTTTDRTTPVDVVGLGSGVNAIVGGHHYTCALVSGGGVKCWGRNDFGQLGDGTTQNRPTPVDVVGLGSGVSAVAAGGDHACALTSGGVKCWGRNDFGQLGDGTTQNRPTPVDVVGLGSGVSAIAAGGDTYGGGHTCAVTNSGGVKCWGRNDAGQVGDNTTTARSTPVDVVGLGSGVSAIVASYLHTCVLTSNGGIKCWGSNQYGQVGDGTNFNNRLTPVDVSGLSSGVSTIAAGYLHICALMSSSGVKCWGRNIDGQLGDGTITDRSTPVDVVGLSSVSTIAAGAGHTCALISGGVKCWGHNGFGQMGDGTGSNRSTPVEVVGLTSGARTVAPGESHTCALTNGGGVKCWGSSYYGQVGDGTNFSHRSTPVDVVGLGSSVNAIAAGSGHTCALTSSGGVKCWGINGSGQVGDGTETFSRPAPVDVVGLSTGVNAIAAGYVHTCVVTNGGGVKCWGGNSAGQLGDGTTTNRSTLVGVVGLSSGVNTITAGLDHTCAVTSSGGVKCWGHNGSGQLGDNTRTNRNTPVDVISLGSGVNAIAAGGTHTCALMNSGGIKCWGDNSLGQVGDGTGIARSTPVDVAGLGSGVTVISAGDRDHTCALMSSGGVKCWGYNGFGQLGDGTTMNRSTPVDVVGMGSGVSTVAVGPYHTCALTNSGGIQCWGNNWAGQLGNDTAWRTMPVDVMELVTPTPTPTNTPTATPTSTPTPTATATPTATPTATLIPPPGGDAYEPDDTCPQAHTIATDGSSQERTFHQAADIDWVQFSAATGAIYRIEVQIPYGSPADVDLEVYGACDSLPVERWGEAFAPGVRIDFKATASAPMHLRLANHATAVAGAHVAYQLAVRQLVAEPQTGAVIIVAGRLRTVDNVQQNIHNVTNAVYALFLAHGYTAADIYYLTTDPSLTGHDAVASANNLRLAITQWAAGKVSADKALTLYLADHGDSDTFFLDQPQGEQVSAQELDGWLTEIETAVPGLQTNVIIETCYSGSFIQNPQSLSKAGRVIITSTNAQNAAYASRQGAYFSDYFVTALQQGRNLFTSWHETRDYVRLFYPLQEPWLDANGNSTPNETADFAIAAQRGFAYAGTLDQDAWPPYIAAAQGPTAIVNRRGAIQAEVRDDQAVDSVWAVVYPPSYTPPVGGQELVADKLDILYLQAEGDNRYSGSYPGFAELGVYRLVIHADDADGLTAAPLVIEVNTASQVFLPLVGR